MPIQSICSGCGQTLRVADEHMGKLAKCPSCGTVYRVGESAGGETQPSPTPGPASPSNDPYAATAYDAPTTEFEAVAAPITPVGANEALRSKTFFAQTPDGKVYGPTDFGTLEKWSTEGRLNPQCLVREADAATWVPLGSILSQSSANPYAVQYSSTAPAWNSSSAPVQSDRSAVVLTLGILSWVVCCFGPICAIIAIVLGYQDLHSTNTPTMSSNSKTMTQVGYYLAIANLVASGIGMALYVVGILLSVG